MSTSSTYTKMQQVKCTRSQPFKKRRKRGMMAGVQRLKAAVMNNTKTEATMCKKLVMTNSTPLQYIDHYNPKSRSKSNLLIKQLVTAKEIPVVCLGNGAVRLIGENPVFLKFNPKTGQWATTINKAAIILGRGYLSAA